MGNADASLKTSVVPNVTNFVTSGQTTCASDANAFSYNTAGVGQFSTATSTTSTTYSIPRFTIPGNTSYNYLFIWSTGGRPNLDLDAVYISKITITESAIVTPVSFTLPATIPFACGSTSAINLAVSNVNGTTGVTNYTWNLGATPNGWLYNNVAAPATVSTGVSNTIALTPVCNTIPKNIAASITITANGNTNVYNTNTSTVAITQPSMSITGSSSFCTGTSNYSIPTLPCNASVAWSVTPTGIVTPNTSIAADPTFTRVGNGNIIISATVTSCGAAQPVVTKTVHVGTNTSSDYVLSGNNGSPYYCTNQTISFGVSGSSSNPSATSSGWVWALPTNWSLITNGGNYVIIRSPTTTSPPTGSLSVSFTEACGTTLSLSRSLIYSSSACNGADPRYTYSPNPAPTTLNVSVASGYFGTVWIKKIELIKTNTGVSVYFQDYSAASIGSTTINMTSFSLGQYTLRIYDGSNWSSYSIMH